MSAYVQMLRGERRGLWQGAPFPGCCPRRVSSLFVPFSQGGGSAGLSLARHHHHHSAYLALRQAHGRWHPMRSDLWPNLITARGIDGAHGLFQAAVVVPTVPRGQRLCKKPLCCRRFSHSGTLNIG
jgi:hypothetical protein